MIARLCSAEVTAGQSPIDAEQLMMSRITIV
jgi:hypothetical protein